MKWIKIAMIVVASLGTLTVMTVSLGSARAASMFGSMWQRFWERLLNILLKAFEAYLETVIRRGYFRVGVPATTIVTAFGDGAEASAAAERGLIYDGHTLTVSNNIVIYVQDDAGVALQKGEYAPDAQGNFQFDLIKVIKPVPSPTFPIPEGGLH